jgi:hypothetical protein
MDRREGGDPMREVTGRLYDFAQSIEGDVIVKGGEFHIEKDDVRAEVVIGPYGKVSYELFKGDERVAGQENTDLETIFQNIEAQASSSDKGEEILTRPRPDMEQKTIEDQMARTLKKDSDPDEVPYKSEDIAA